MPPAACWREVHFPESDKIYWQFHIPGYAVLGTVQEAVPGAFEGMRSWTKGVHWYWDVRVMSTCSLFRDGGVGNERTHGLATSLAGAKEIVEVILKHTGTYPPDRSTFDAIVPGDESND